MAWHVGPLVANAPEQVILVATGKGRLADEHFVKENPERPPVDALVVFQPFYHLEMCE